MYPAQSLFDHQLLHNLDAQTTEKGDRFIYWTPSALGR